MFILTIAGQFRALLQPGRLFGNKLACYFISMKKIFICMFGALLLTPEIASAAQPQSLQEQKPQPEKLHLHLDRTFYAVSDTVWFKAYLTDAITHKLLPGPEVIHLDLISEDNQSVLSRQLITSQGTVAGNLIIPDSLKTGSYLVQAYTNWQRNAGQQTFFRQPVYVVGASRSPGEQAAGKTVGKPDEKVLKSLEFFPESGRLLPGFELKVAFKALAADGAGIPVKGDLLDEAGKVILTFSAEANGSGSFRLQPQPGKTYTAKVINGSEVHHFPMPVATSGQTFRVRSTPDSVQLTFFSNSQGKPTPVLLLLKSQGNLLSSDSVQFNSNGFR
ncbi:MAG TPA: hypothetical protein VK927_09440, partial [Adhaeribacter sp.]|nr:hypothetical protein [Adhaeribacter sp.]